MKSIITTFALSIISLLAFSQTRDYTKLDSFFTILEENDRFFGSVAVMQGDEVLYSKALGYADLEAQLPNNIETKFRIGSISKTFTATLIMQAVEEGIIILDDTIESYFPDILNADKITLRQLLNHRSGITNFTDRSYVNWHTEAITQAALLDTIISKGSDFDPNTDYAYSNSNYVLLTFVLEKVYKKPYAQILEEQIVQPLALAHTHYGTAISTANNEAKSYYMKSEWKSHSEDNMSIPLGAGGIVSTPTDLCLFIKALFNGTLISLESLEQMKPVGDDSYGFALYDTPFDDQTGWGHGGNIDAFASNLIYFPESDISIALSCNGSNFGTHDVEIAVLSEILGQSYDLPDFNFVELTSEELDQYLGTYVTDELPMDIIITKKENVLLLQVTGQSASPIMAEGDDQFSVMKYGVKVKFTPAENKMLFEQQGMSFELVKQSEVETAKEETVTTISSNENLDQYLGTYTSELLPIDLTIRKEDNVLVGQGEGQPSFSLVAEGDHTYTNKDIGLKITFVPTENKMHFVQGGAAFEMVLEEE